MNKETNIPKRILFHCSTPFQIMMAVHFKRTILADCIVDILVSSHIFEYKDIAERLENVGLFRMVISYDGYNFDQMVLTIKKKMALIRDILNSRHHFNYLFAGSGKVEDAGKYDEFWIQEIIMSTNVLYNYLISRNDKMKIVFYEESPLTVVCDGHDTFVDREYAIKSKSNIERIILRFLIKSVYGKIDYGYSSVYDKIKDRFYFPFYAIPELDKNKNSVADWNKIWKCQDDYSDKVVFFEESFHTDSIEFDDMSVVQDIIDVVGKENLMIKLHPRSRKNRFQALGVQTNRSTSVPWELVAINHINNPPVLISVASGSLLYPQMYWGIKQNAISLIKCKEYKMPVLDSRYYNEYRQFCENSGYTMLPETREDFRKILKKMVEGRS